MQLTDEHCSERMTCLHCTKKVKPVSVGAHPHRLRPQNSNENLKRWRRIDIAPALSAFLPNKTSEGVNA